MKLSTKYLKITANYIFMILLILGCIYVLPRLLSFFAPFVVAYIIALIANPLVRFLEKKIKIKRKAGSVFVIILTLAVVVLGCYGLIYLIVTETSGLIANIPDIWGKITSAFATLEKDMGRFLTRMPGTVRDGADKIAEAISVSMSSWASSIGEEVAARASDGVKNIPQLLVSIVMGVLASYSFVAERDNVAKTFEKIIPEDAKIRYNLVTSTMRNAVGGYFKAQFKIMGFVYLVLLVGFLILGIQYSLLVALLVALLDFLPFFGTGTVMWPWAFIALMQKDYKLCIGMMIVWGVSQLVRQLIQPKVLSDSVGMPAIPTLILLYVGFRISGALGLIVAVPIGMILYNLYKAGVFSNFIYSTRILGNEFKKMRVYTKDELLSEGITPTDTGVKEAEND